jgi:N-methylhydantoinase B
MTPGGGGYGDPFARAPALVARDVGRGYYTTAQARELFGVVLASDATVDAIATAQLRKTGGVA